MFEATVTRVCRGGSLLAAVAGEGRGCLAFSSRGSRALDVWVCPGPEALGLRQGLGKMKEL